MLTPLAIGLAVYLAFQIGLLMVTFAILMVIINSARGGD